MNDTLDEFSNERDLVRYELWSECMYRGYLKYLPNEFKKKRPTNIPSHVYYRVLFKNLPERVTKSKVYRVCAMSKKY